MTKSFLVEKQRQRAPSKRALETRSRIMDAAERVFARHGYDAASIRDIAAEADVQGALVNHHGGSKEELFWRVVARRADILAAARLEALERRKARGPLTVPAVLECFLAPFFERTEIGGCQWLAYARLVAIVSSDDRWRDLAAICFDPTAQIFVSEIEELYPPQARNAVAGGFVYSVAAMLALITSEWRIDALGPEDDDSAGLGGRMHHLITFCAAGLDATAAATSS